MSVALDQVSAGSCVVPVNIFIRIPYSTLPRPNWDDLIDPGTCLWLVVQWTGCTIPRIPYRRPTNWKTEKGRGSRRAGKADLIPLIFLPFSNRDPHRSRSPSLPSKLLLWPIKDRYSIMMATRTCVTYQGAGWPNWFNFQVGLWGNFIQWIQFCPPHTPISWSSLNGV